MSDARENTDMTAKDEQRTMHTFKPSTHHIAHYTCPHLRRYVEWSGREWGSKTGPTFEMSGRAAIRRYEHVE